ncbi:protein FAM200A-like [Diabrotica undecimpunctata]|uniref:protein FAM200A-like n=1 Tax=Diabrotica undecimpunctata TaxID=50387 RepID=UPI003B64083F
MAKAFGDSKMAEKFESVPLSHQTIQRRIVAMGEQVEKSMLSLAKKSSYFSLCLDESTDQTDVSQLLIFVRTTFDDFTSKEELFDICPLYGTTKGKDIYEAVKKTIDRIGGFDKCSAIATDGAPSMTGSFMWKINKCVSSDTTELEEKFKDPEFLRQLAFITDLTNHLNMLNLSLQGRNWIPE